MPEPVVIRVENLGKRYYLAHQSGGRSRYTALRDVITEGAKGWWRRAGSGEAASPAREEFWALREVSFEVRRGDVVGIIGRNGAGKSTLLKLLSRITEPTVGRVSIKGRVASLLEVGTGFHPELTGRENIYLNGAILGMGKAEIRAKFDEIVAFAEVERFLDTPVKHFSSGMYMRLAFAVAAHLQPEILLIDEVLAVGDAEFQKKCLGKMEQVAASEGRTVFFVSHNMAAVRQLCRRAIFMAGGRVATEGPVDTVLKAYLTDAAAGDAVVDLSGYRSQHGHGEMTARSMELTNAVGRRFAVAWDEPIRLKICFDVCRPIANASIAIGVQTTDYVPLFTVRSADGQGPLTTLTQAGRLEAEVTIHHNLRAGIYNLLLGVASGNYAYYYHPHAAQLEVLDVGTAPYPARNTGLIHCRSDWECRHVLP